MKRENLPVRRSYRFRLTGFLYLAVTAFLAIAAISSQNNLLFWCLGMATAGIAVSGMTSGAGLMGVRVEREAIPEAAASGELLVRYRVSNANRFVPAFGLVIYERPPGWRKRSTSPWTLFVSRPVAFVSVVGPRQSVVAEAPCLALRRGKATFGEFIVESSFPFGLATKSLRFAQERSVLIYPQSRRVRPALFDFPNTTGDAVGARARAGSAAGEFYGVREYAPGDPPRTISWPASARLGDLVVRQHASPMPRRLWIELELSAAPDDEARERTIELAAGAVRQGLSAGFAVGLSCAEAGIVLAPATGRVALRNALASLAMIDRASAPAAPTREGPAPSQRDLRLLVIPTAAGAERLARRRIAAWDDPATWAPSATPTGAGRVA